MRPTIVCLFAVACAGPRSSFEMTLSGDLDEQVGSSSSTTGSVDNAGNLTIDDSAWSLSMTLPGLAPGQNIQAPTTFERVQPRLTITGTCIVNLADHPSTNGSPIKLTFACPALTSPDGTTHVTVAGGSLTTQIDDSANNPSSCVLPLCP